MDTPQVLLEHYLKQLHLPSVLREYPKLAEQCAKEGTTFEVFLLRLVELEMTDRERRATERRIKAAKFPVTKGLETFNFLAIPSVNKAGGGVSTMRMDQPARERPGSGKLRA